MIIPKLTDYGIHPQHGFLPADPPPLRRLPAYFEPWESILDILRTLLLAGQLRDRVNKRKLELLDVSRVTSTREWQRAYLVLSFIGQAYVWGKNEEAVEVLPEAIAVPWCKACEVLELKPVITYSVNMACNMGMQHIFSGGMDEEWFFLISVGIEAAGAPALPAIIQCLKSIENNDLKALSEGLHIIHEAINKITTVLMRMYEKTDPHVFFHRVRPYMNGWEKSDDLPKGVLYEGVKRQGCVPNGEEIWEENGRKGTYGKYAGASAGQSTLIHVLDVALGVSHDKPEVQKSRAVSVIHEMRNYMPGPHRRFIDAVAESYSIRSFIHIFNKCVEGMRAFRDKHIQMVTVYIVIPARKRRTRGTGGTNLIPFLKQTRNETRAAMIDPEFSNV
ncbi:Indoleamine 2,3-dioxygenase [Chytridium lagenaria]|nr:Indoleamine 2,3-dioxygenase [Chytridium lagenaria]